LTQFCDGFGGGFNTAHTLIHNIQICHTRFTRLDEFHHALDDITSNAAFNEFFLYTLCPNFIKFIDATIQIGQLLIRHT